MKSYIELLPNYLDTSSGTNIYRHGEIIDSENRFVNHQIRVLGQVFTLSRPILFDGVNVYIDVDDEILEIRVYYDDDSVEVTSFDELTTETVVTGENIIRVEVITDDVTYTKTSSTMDSTIDTLGLMLQIERFGDETDYNYLQRLRYFVEHYGTDDLALLMLNLLYNVTESDIYSSGEELNQLVVRDWGVTDYDEVQKFSDKYCPITRPLMVVPPIKVKKVTTSYIEFEDYYPESMIEETDAVFYNLTAEKHETPTYTSPRRLTYTTTNVFDKGSNPWPVYSYLYCDFGNDNYYLHIFRAQSIAYVARREFYLGEAVEKYEYIVEEGVIPDSWFEKQVTATLSVDSSSITIGSSVTLTGSVTSEGTALSEGTVTLKDGGTTVSSVDLSTDEPVFTVTPTAGTHEYKITYSDGVGPYGYAESSVVTVVVNKVSSSLVSSVSVISTTVGYSTTITGTLSVAGTATSGETVKLLDYDGSTLSTTTTGTGGSFSFTYSPQTTGASGHSIQLSYEGTSTIASASKSIPVTINKQSSSITVSSDSISITYGSSTTITGTLSIDSTGTSGETVKLLDYDGTTIDTTTTTTGGSFSFTYSPSSMSVSGNNIQVKYEGTSTVQASSKSIAVTVTKRNSNISTSSDTVTATVNSTTLITGTLSIGGTGTSGETVKLLDSNGNVHSTTTTTSGGSFSMTYIPSSTADNGHNIQVVYEATSTTNGSSKNIAATVNKQSGSITTTSDSLTLYYGSTGTITGTYKIENTGSSGATIKLKAGNTLLDTATTGSGGAFTFNYTANDWSLSGSNLTLLVEETSTVSSATKNIALTLQRHTTTLSVADVTGSVGDTVDIVVYATDENGDPVSEGTVTVEITQQSNNS